MENINRRTDHRFPARIGSYYSYCIKYRRHSFLEASYYLWRSKFGGMNVSDAKRLRALLFHLRQQKPRTLAMRGFLSCGVAWCKAGAPDRNRTCNCPLGGGRYIHLTTETKRGQASRCTDSRASSIMAVLSSLSGSGASTAMARSAAFSASPRA